MALFVLLNIFEITFSGLIFSDGERYTNCPLLSFSEVLFSSVTHKGSMYESAQNEAFLKRKFETEVFASQTVCSFEVLNEILSEMGSSIPKKNSETFSLPFLKKVMRHEFFSSTPSLAQDETFSAFLYRVFSFSASAKKFFIV